MLSIYLLCKGTYSIIGVNITCDSYLELYVDGRLLGGGETNVKSKGFLVYQTMPGSHVVALSCKASSSAWEGGILGSFENGLVTDTSWKCITTARYGWNMRTYRDDDWPMASSYGANNLSTLPWGGISSIDEKAVWIWSSDNKKDTEVYCRHSLVAPCTEGTLLVLQCVPCKLRSIVPQTFKVSKSVYGRHGKCTSTKLQTYAQEQGYTVRAIRGKNNNINKRKKQNETTGEETKQLNFCVEQWNVFYSAAVKIVKKISGGRI